MLKEHPCSKQLGNVEFSEERRPLILIRLMLAGRKEGASQLRAAARGLSTLDEIVSHPGARREFRRRRRFLPGPLDIVHTLPGA